MQLGFGWIRHNFGKQKGRKKGKKRKGSSLMKLKDGYCVVY